MFVTGLSRLISGFIASIENMGPTIKKLTKSPEKTVTIKMGTLQRKIVNIASCISSPAIVRISMFAIEERRNIVMM